MDNASSHLLRLLHLTSPSLPTGAFAYSQGLEWAVEAGWVKTAEDLQVWLADLMRHTWAYVDIPILVRMVRACQEGNAARLAQWSTQLLALRESNELRMEERQRGQAMVSLLQGLCGALTEEEKQIISHCQLAGFAKAIALWNIPIHAAANGYLWSWLENQVITGIKLIPLGQTQGHKILSRLDESILEAVESGLRLSDEEIGASSPALAIAGSRHETQYTRLYRS